MSGIISSEAVSIMLRFGQFLLAALVSQTLVIAESIQNQRLEIGAEVRDGAVRVSLKDHLSGCTWAEGPYCYFLRLENELQIAPLAGLKSPVIRTKGSGLEITGTLGASEIRVIHRLSLSRNAPWVEEQIVLENAGKQPVQAADFAFGFQRQLRAETNSVRLVAVPYRRQVDGKLHDYSMADLLFGRFDNSDWQNDPAVADQVLSDAGKLRSEAWVLTDGSHSLLMAKYNPDQIEYSVASVERDEGKAWLRFGGAGLALYREPRAATAAVPPEGSIDFGVTRYTALDGDWPQGYAAYHVFLNEKGHVLPRDYSPPLNWNELYDVGWYHSDREQLLKFYTREALFKEAAKAKEIGCDLLYLDPGWEICEGTTLWDSERLGPVADFARELKERFHLRLGYRTIGRVYRDEFPHGWYLRRQGQVGEYQRPRLGSQPEPDPAPLFAPDGRRNLALLVGARASASSVIPGYPELHTVAHLNDGYYENPASWVSAQDPSWVEIDLGAVYTINEVAFGSEHQPRFNDRAVDQFEVRVATGYAAPPQDRVWKSVFNYNGAPIHTTEHFRFDPVDARWVQVLIRRAEGSSARIDELEIYEATRKPNVAAPRRRAPPKIPEGPPLGFWEVCTQSKDWQREKLKRILAVTGGGVDFMMFDEFDWRGPCYDPTHGHPVPSTPEGHVRAIYGLVEAMRARYPQVLVEAHDPIWPWGARYTPTYYHQGFTNNHYQENWGFEFMWNPIEDLRSGRALCLYYYNLACEIPLYDHITMEGDNDNCLAFWWFASTVRHLGIGGKKGLNSEKENEVRYAAYRKAVAEYNRLRPLYARGEFIGLDETAHLHVLADERKAVLNVFNLTSSPLRKEVRVDLSKVGLGAGEPQAMRFWPENSSGKEAGSWRKEGGVLVLTFDLPPLGAAHAIWSPK